MLATVAGATGGAAGLLAARLLGGDSAHQALAAALAASAVVGAVVIPFGVSVDRALSALRRRLLSDETSAGAPAVAWLRPLTAALGEVRERLAADSTQAAARLREIEITHHLAENELRRASAVLDSMRDAVLVTNAYDELTHANAPAARLFGFTLPADLRKPVDQIIQDEAIVRQIRSARHSGSPGDRRRAEVAIRPAAAHADVFPIAPGDNDTRHFEITLTHLPGAAPADVSGVVTILHDVTREKEINQMKSDFVSQVSHELRTPLSSINAYVEMLVDGEAGDEASRAEFYGVIKNEADRLGRLIDNMLNISRIEAGIFSLERTEVDFVALARQAVEVMQPQAQIKHITLIQKAGPLVYTAQADKDMMLQVMLNLVSNAVKYTPEGGRVTVSIENDDASRSVLVSVSDTGLGIPPDAIPRLFGKFYRIENYKRVAKGTGLGLNLVKHIIETVHGGQVGVSSKVGMGSRFWFTVPYEPAARAAA